MKKYLLLLSTLITAATSLSASAATLSDRAEPPELDGQRVERILNIESVSDWRTLDTQHLTMRVNHAQNYLLTLAQPCAHLRGARLVGVSMTNQEIWADFDHIAADGWECRIDSITRLKARRS